MFSKKNFFLIFVVVFFLNTFSFSQEQAVDKNALTYTLVNKISIPEEFGIIKEKYIPNHGQVNELIVYIQDAHCNYEAQQNIAKMIEIFIEKMQFKLVNVEGTAGIIDTKPFSAFKDRKVKMEFAEYFMKQGKITGPEYLSITSDLEFTIYGIEDETLYAENYTAFMNTIDVKDKIVAYTSKLLLLLDQLKEFIYGPDLLKVDEVCKKYDCHEMEFEEYTKYLEEWAKEKNLDLSGFPNFVLQTKTRLLEEKIDFKEIETQRSALIQEFQKKLENNTEELTRIVKQSLAFKMREVDANDYYNFLITEAKNKEISLENFPLVIEYAKYLECYHAIDKGKIIDELSEAERFIKKSFYKNELEKELDHLYRVMNILTKLFNLEVIKSDYEFFINSQEEFSFEKSKSFILKHGSQHGIFLRFSFDDKLISENLPHVVNFYKAALKRDRVLIENAIARMKEDKTDRFVLITGGFHTDGLLQVLKEKNLCYVLIAPRITDPLAETPYIEVMKAQADSVKGYGT